MSEIIPKLTGDFNHLPDWSVAMEKLRMRIMLLQKDDRYLIKLYFYKSLSFRDLSRLSGLEEKLVARRIRQITQRLLSDEYITILRHKSQFSEIELAVAYDRYLLGLGYRKIAKRHNLGGRPTLRIIRRLEYWLRGRLKKI